MDDIDRLDEITDPVERALEIGRRLKAIPTYTAALRAKRQAAVLELRARGWSYAQVGAELGMHRNRAQQIAEGRPGGGKGGRGQSDGE